LNHFKFTITSKIILTHAQESTSSIVVEFAAALGDI
jgi:hypothetical protein